MRSISLHQPWAQWVMMGVKTIETRTHDRFKNLAGQRIAIHAAQKFDKEAPFIARPYLKGCDLSDIKCPTSKGVILCTAMVKEARPLNADDSKAALCDCSGDNLFGLILEDIIKVDPIPYKGQQGIFNVPDHVIELPKE